MKRTILLTFILTLVSNLMAQNTEFKDFETQKLLDEIKTVASNGKTIFGVANGVSMNFDNPLSQKPIIGDCKQITGKNPKFIENDFLFSSQKEFWQQEISATKEFHKNGGIVGYCWHLESRKSKNFRTNSLDSLTAKNIISKTENEDKKWFLSLIDTLLTPTFKNLGFPILFRPFHEMNGGWFWWGKTSIKPTEYVELYRLTVERLRENGVKNLLYVFAPDTYWQEEYYPGDDYVDIIGVDAYEPGCSPYHGKKTFERELKKMLQFAQNHSKAAAISETGLREIDGVYNYPEKIPDFWTKYVLKALNRNPGISYVMAWYNADWKHDGKGPAYIPHKDFQKLFHEKGEKAVQDFKNFSKNQRMIFLE